jgi:hypothetical protein
MKTNFATQCTTEHGDSEAQAIAADWAIRSP